MPHEHQHKPAPNGAVARWKQGITVAVIVSVLSLAGGAMYKTGVAAEKIDHLEQRMEQVDDYMKSNQALTNQLESGQSQLRANDERDYQQQQRILNSLEAINRRLNQHPAAATGR